MALAANITPTEARLETLVTAFATVKETWQAVDRDISGKDNDLGADAMNLAAAVKFTSSAMQAASLAGQE